MKRSLAALGVSVLFVVGSILAGYAQSDRAQQDPFFARNHRGELVHVLPTPASIHVPNDAQREDAPPSNEAAVYRASYGAGNLLDHGGLEIANAEFQAIYWNAAVAGSTQTSTLNGHKFATIADQIAGFIAAFTSPTDWTDIATSDYNIIQQYGSSAPISHSLQSNPDKTDGNTTQSAITDAQIEGYLTSIFNGQVSGLNLQAQPNVIYGVYFPDGMSVSLGGAASCTNFCGYHSHFTYGSGPTAVEVKYAVFPFPNCSGCTLSGKSVADMLTIVTSHEIREAVTDPGDSNQDAWYDRAGYEADDKCAWHNLYQMSNGGFWVQPEYSNGGTVTRFGYTATYPGPGCVVPNAVSGGGHGKGK